MTIRRGLRTFLFWAFGLGLACATGHAPAQTPAQTLELRAAQASVTVNGQTQQQAVSLPYHWDRQHPGLAGAATFELPFGMPADLDKAILGCLKVFRIDLRRYEAAVIAGAAGVIERDRPTLLVELEERHSSLRIEQSIADIQADLARGLTD